MASPPSSFALVGATPVFVTAQGGAGTLPSHNWTALVRGLVTLGESILVALAFPFIVLGLGLPMVLLVRLVLELFRALVH